MFTAFTLMTAMMASPAAPATYTIVDVDVKKVFAGTLGNRIKTELTVTRNGKQVHIFIQDRRHDRFQSSEAKWKRGDRVSLPELGNSSKAYLRPDQIK